MGSTEWSIGISRILLDAVHLFYFDYQIYGHLGYHYFGRKLPRTQELKELLIGLSPFQVIMAKESL